MFSSRIITVLLSLIISVALAMPKADVTLETKDVATNTTCWVGDIHEPCYGHENGCTPYGWKVGYYFLYIFKIHSFLPFHPHGSTFFPSFPPFPSSPSSMIRGAQI